MSVPATMLLFQAARGPYRGGGPGLPPEDEETKKKRRRRAIIAAVLATLFGIGVACYVGHSYYVTAQKLKFMYTSLAPTRTPK